LLTVITIIAILATLLMTTLGSAKRKAREAVCTSNLRQIGLALNMYLDDFTRRPTELQTLARSRYLNTNVLVCPADRTWFLSRAPQDNGAGGGPGLFGGSSNGVSSIYVSYQHPLGWSDEDWNRLMQAQTRAGVVICPFHDVRTASRNVLVAAGPPEGLILRGQLDGTVVRRQVFRSAIPAQDGAAPPGSDRGNDGPMTTFEPTDAESGGTVTSPWQLFSDEPAP
jgi:type II secretory pathway pseudopilin PulG